MESPPRGLRSDTSKIRTPGGGYVCLPPERQTTEILFQDMDPTGGRAGCPRVTLATGDPVLLPPNSHSGKGAKKDKEGEGTGGPCGPSVAEETLVLRAEDHGNRTTLDPTPPTRPPLSGPHIVHGGPVVKPSSLEIERAALEECGYTRAVIDTLLSSRRQSTNRIYQSTWNIFTKWCAKQPVSPTKSTTKHILSFLQEGLAMGLRPNTLKRQASAISSILANGAGTQIASHPHIRRFLRGASLIAPPVRHRFPTWRLPLVLKQLTKAPFEPIKTISIRCLSLKVAFLVAITSARRVSELAALSVREHLCSINSDHAVLRVDPSFQLKVLSKFHVNQEIILPSFCPRPSNQTERSWHKLDVRRALKVYIKRTKPFRTCDSLFVSFNPGTMGQKAARSTIASWIKACIFTAYDTAKLPRPSGVLAHSTRSASTSAVFSSNAPIEEICKAATWSTPSTFVRHYKIDDYRKADARFGRRVLQEVIRD